MDRHTAGLLFTVLAFAGTVGYVAASAAAKVSTRLDQLAPPAAGPGCYLPLWQGVW